MPKYESDRTAHLASLIKQGLTEAVGRGDVVSFVPIGYLIRWTEAGKQVLLDEERAPMVAHGFMLAAQGKSIRHIWRTLQQAGLTSRANRPICVASVHHFLRNPFYVGIMRYGNKRYRGNYQPLISHDLFDQVQAALTARKPKYREEADHQTDEIANSRHLRANHPNQLTKSIESKK